MMIQYILILIFFLFVCFCMLDSYRETISHNYKSQKPLQVSRKMHI